MLSNLKLPKNWRYVFLLNPLLGDSLVTSITINNFIKANYHVTVFSDIIYQLKRWFPHITAYPTKNKAELLRKLQEADQIILFHENHLPEENYIHLKRRPIILREFDQHYHRGKPLFYIHKDIMEKQFNFKAFIIDNGITPPANLVPRKFKQRVIIHVSASFPHKEYLPQRFIKLAKKLIFKGFDCYFIVAPFEYDQWKWVLDYGIKLPKFSSLDEMAQFIYESGYFIGNDSGIGHLASNLGLPTLSLFQRRKLLYKWRPLWSLNISIIPPSILLFVRWKEKFWKYLIPWQQVYYKFMQLIKKDQKTIENEIK